MTNTNLICKSSYIPKLADLGKLILYRENGGDIVLATNQINLIDQYGSLPTSITLHDLEFWAEELSGPLGPHVKIAIKAEPEPREVYGGASFFIPNDKIFRVFGESQYYGPVNDELVQRCLGSDIKIER